MPENRLHFLDCFRGLAILAVLLCHSLATVFGYNLIDWDGDYRAFHGYSWQEIALWPLSFGQAGVAIFFVISGFCIHLNYQKDPDWKRFFIRRFFRLYPAYIASLVLFCILLSPVNAVGVWSNPLNWKELFSHLFLVHNFWPQFFKSINPAYWSLAIEAQLYLMYPVLLFAIRCIGWPAIILILLLQEVLLNVWGNETLMRLPWAFWFSWSIGAWLAERHLKNQPIFNIGFIPMLFLTLSSYFHKSISCLWFTLWAITTAIAIGKILSGQWKFDSLPKWVAWPLKKLGDWSYSLYLIHQPLLILYVMLWQLAIPKAQVTKPQAFFLVIGLWVIIIPLAALWYRAFEVPSIGIGKWFIAQNYSLPKAALIAFLTLAAIFGTVILKIYTSHAA